jgi:hypothetical protein
LTRDPFHPSCKNDGKTAAALASRAKQGWGRDDRGAETARQ